MSMQIAISRKGNERDNNEHKIISVRMKENLLDQIDTISRQTNRSRNEIINLLLKEAVDAVIVED